MADVQYDNKTGHYQNLTFNQIVQKYVAKNVPPLKNEPYVTSREDIISKIKFELASVNLPNRPYQEIMPPSYPLLSKKIANYDYYKGLNKNPFMKEDIDRLLHGVEDDEARIEKLYYFVRDSFEIDKEVYSDNMRKIWKLRKGYPVDINGILVSMLKEAGYDAHMVKLSTRTHGKLHSTFAMLSSFNHTVCGVLLNEKEYLLDPSDKLLPFNVLDKNCLNGQGMIISEDKFHWFDLSPRESSKRQIIQNLEIKEGGMADGSVEIAKTGYEALSFRRKLKKAESSDSDDSDESQSVISVSNYTVEGVEDTSAPIQEKFNVEIEDYAQEIGDLLYMTPLAYGRVKENPFKANERLYPINFGHKIYQVITARVIVPKGYSIEEMPEPVAMRLPNNGGTFVYSVSFQDGVLIVNSQYVINKDEFGADDYANLKEFYARIVSKQAEQVVLKKS